MQQMNDARPSRPTRQARLPGAPSTRTGAPSARTGAPSRHDPGGIGLIRLATADLNLLVPLLALLEERSVTRAARRVELSQPAMSHALARMRRLLGDELLVRHGSGMVLTPRALELVVPLRRALQETASIFSPAPFDPAVDQRVITMAMTTSTALVIGRSIARLLAERAPHVVLKVQTAPLTSLPPAMFTHDGVDVVLLSEAFACEFPRERLYDDRWVVITGRRARRAMGAAELVAALPHVAFDSPAHRSKPYEILDERKLPYVVRQYVTDNLVIPHLVAGADVVAFHRHSVVTALDTLLHLRVEEFPYPIQSLGIDMVWNPWLADDRRREWLREVLLEAAVAVGSHGPVRSLPRRRGSG